MATPTGQKPTRHPLTWPIGWKRHESYMRKWSQFRGRGGNPISVFEAIGRLESELAKVWKTTNTKDKDALISTNVPLGLRGLPESLGRRDTQPADPGVALYFKVGKADRCLACDRYTDVSGNLAAIAAHLEALRAMDRHGVGTIEQAFAGYAALPVGSSDWRNVFEFSATEAATWPMVEERYRYRAGQAHPDRPTGSHDAMARLNEARDAARLELLGARA